jgi:hypothetical protein
VGARQVGQVLRLGGPLIQLACLIGLFRTGRPEIRSALFVGFGLGFLLVILGNVLARLPRRERRPAHPKGELPE